MVSFLTMVGVAVTKDAPKATIVASVEKSMVG